MARHRRTLYWGLAATVWCSVAASVVPYWSGRAVNALERSDWHGSRVFLAWMLLWGVTVAGDSTPFATPFPEVAEPMSDQEFLELFSKALAAAAQR